VTNVSARLLAITCGSSQQLGDLPDENKENVTQFFSKKKMKDLELQAGQPNLSAWEVYRAGSPGNHIQP